MQAIGGPYDPVPAGSEFWHAHSEAYAPNSFNPHSRNRFAAHEAAIARAMLYASDSSDGALWETLLRDIVPQAAPPHAVVLPPIAGYRIARLRLRREAQILDLNPLALRRLIADSHRRDRVRLLTQTPKYLATHGEAVRLLMDWPHAAGMRWTSRQTGADGAYVFYAPPLSAIDFDAFESFALDSRRGLQLIDQALSRAGMHRLDSSALASEIESQLPASCDEDT